MTDHRISPPEGQGPDAGETASDQVTFRILATTDLHVHLAPWDYHADRESPAVGLARTAGLIAGARAEVPGALLLDNGDFLQGSPLGEVAAMTPGAVHPMIAAMNALGYDAATLGNHEFSTGLDFLLERLQDTAFPVISANIARRLGASPLDDETLLPATLVLTRKLSDGRGQAHDLRIGLIGLAPPQTTQWDRAHLGNRIQTRDIVEAAAAHVPALKAAGADIVIALSHSGIGATAPAPQMENATAALAALPGIDALVAGHTHLAFPAPEFPAAPDIDPVQGRLFGKPAVLPGFNGSHLGVIDLALRRQAGTWAVTGSRAELRPIARRDALGEMRALTASDPAIAALAEAAHQATRRWASRPIGHNPVPLHSYFAMVSPTPGVRLIAAAQAAHVRRALLGTPHAGLPVISAAAPFRAGGRGGPENYTHIAAGPLVMRHAFDLYPHPNTIAALLLTGAELHLWLERSFSQFRQITPGIPDQPLLDADFPSFNFCTLEPLTWTVDLAQPPRFDADGREIDPTNRIRDLALHGQPLDPQGRYVLATNSYRASGSGGFPGAAPDRIIFSAPRANRDILLAHITEHGLPAPAPPNWRFLPMPGTSVLFDSAPAAAQFTADLAPLRVDPLDIAASGFRQFRLHL